MKTVALDRLLDELRHELRQTSDEIPEQLPAGELLREELGIDSLALLEFVARVEYRYGFVVIDEDWKRLTTLDEVANYVVAHSAS